MSKATERYRRTQTRPDLPDPYNDRILPDYLNSVERWFGYIRFLGLPDRNETPDYPIDKLFVHPYAHTRHVRIDEDPNTWQSGLLGIMPLVEKHRRLVLLGDPGSGKSTLLSYIAWQFTARSGDWLDKFGPLVPIPIIIRDLAIGPDITWDGLCDKFLNHAVAKGMLTRPKFDELVHRGQAFFLIDGLDELTNREAREKLRATIFFGMTNAEASCHWLLTSRIVGYDEIPYDGINGLTNLRHIDIGDAVKLDIDERSKLVRIGMESGEAIAFPVDITRYYVAPFDDRQVDLFALNWFRARDSRPDMESHVRRFLNNLRSEKGPADLARNPTLLTLTSLIYLTYNVLPHGRAMLYAKVAEAYLESIDRARGFDTPFTKPRMERWLGYIAFRMQLQRANEENQSSPKEILATSQQIEKWLTKDMKQIGGAPTKKQAEEFLQYAGRRTGLFLPRGEGVYAFTHLSFQEYFAALFLAEALEAADPDDPPIEGATPEAVRQHAATTVWRETLILLFEIQSAPHKTRKLRKVLFGNRFELPSPPQSNDLGRALLLSELLIDPFNGLEDDERETACIPLMEWEWGRQHNDMIKLLDRGPFAALLSASGHNTDARQRKFRKLLQAKAAKTKRLQLSGCTGLTAPPNLDHATALEILNLSGCTGLTAPPNLDHATALEILNLSGCTGLTAPPNLDHATALESLNLSGCTGLTAPPNLDHATALEILNLSRCTGLTAPPNLDHATALEILTLSGCTGLTAPPNLDHATALETLNLSGCTGLTAPPNLNHATALQFLFLMDCTGLTAPPDLDHTTKLVYLFLTGCTGLTTSPKLDNTKALEILHMSGCTGLTAPPDLDNASALSVLNLSGCTGIKRLPPKYGRPELNVIFP